MALFLIRVSCVANFILFIVCSFGSAQTPILLKQGEMSRTVADSLVGTLLT